MKLVVLDGYTLNPGDLSWQALEKFGDLSVCEMVEEESVVLKRIQDADIVFTNKTPLSKAVLKQCSNLKYIGVLATGYNIVDVAAAHELGIVVTNVPSYGTAAVAQHVFALLLEITTHVGHHDRTVKAGKWSAQPNFCYWDYPLMELAGKTMGILGYGRIGRETAKIAKAFGMKVLGYSPESAKGSDAYATCADFDTLLADSDVISLHCPLFDSTYHIINKDTISKMKQSAIVINTSRGPLIDQSSLYEALKSNRLYAAGLDVTEKEPIEADNPLLTLDNCIITPHIAWAPLESRARLLDIAIENLSSYLEGTVIHSVGGAK